MIKKVIKNHNFKRMKSKIYNIIPNIAKSYILLNLRMTFYSATLQFYSCKNVQLKYLKYTTTLSMPLTCGHGYNKTLTITVIK